MNVLVVTRMWPTPERPRRGPSVHREVAALRALGVHCHVVVPSSTGRVLPYVEMASETRRQLRTGSFDVVHAHYGYSAAPARMQWSVPLVVTFHGSDLIPRTDDSGRATSVGKLETRLSRQLSRAADAVIVVAEHMVSRQASLAVRVIPAGVDLATFHPTPKAQARTRLGLDASRGYVLFAADPRLTVKRYPLAQAAVERLRDKRGSVELRAVSGRPHDEIALWMSAADALILTSITEGSPMVVKEAMACDLPVVAVPVGDVAGRLARVRNCHVVDAVPDLLAEALEAVLASGERSNGREFAHEFEIMHTANQVIETYDAVLARARRRGRRRGRRPRTA